MIFLKLPGARAPLRIMWVLPWPASTINHHLKQPPNPPTYLEPPPNEPKDPLNPTKKTPNNNEESGEIKTPSLKLCFPSPIPSLNDQQLH